jgi:hypothetical protein
MKRFALAQLLGRLELPEGAEGEWGWKNVSMTARLTSMEIGSNEQQNIAGATDRRGKSVLDRRIRENPRFILVSQSVDYSPMSYRMHCLRPGEH